MKRYLYNLLVAQLLAFSLHAGVITITYDASQGVSNLSGANEVYIHSGGNPSAGLLNASSWKYVMGNWGMADGIGKMTSLGNNRWSITIDPIAYYSQAINGPVIGANIQRIGMVFRNENGSLQGKDDFGSDIFIDLSSPIPAAFNSDGSPFGGITVTLNLNTFSASTATTRFLAVTHYNDTLKIIDSSNYSTIRAIRMTCDSTILGATGLSRHPQTGIYYILLRFPNLYNRYLGTINPATGAVTIIGNIGDRMSNIIFLPSGKLIGVSGNGALTPESLFSIDLTTGAPTFIRTLGAGSAGESIGYCPDNGYIYHRSGLGTQAYEKIDTVNYNITPLPQTNNPGAETFCMLYTGNGNFFSNDGNNSVVNIDTNGVYTYKTTLTQTYKGVEYISCVRNITGNLVYCNGSSTILTASPGASAYFWYKNGVLIPGQTNSFLVVNSPGKYNCVFSDNCGLDSLPTSLTIQQLALPIVNLSGGAGFCSGGSVTLMGSGGGSSQWYLNGILINGATSATYTASVSGLYNMIKTNTNGCSDSAAVGKSISEFPLPNLSIATLRNLKCFADNSGELSCLVSGGTAPFTYSWSNGASSNSLNSLSAGNYEVIVTDSKSCKDTISATVTEPLPLQLSLLGNSVLCNGGATGSAVASASGGSGTLIYSWSNGNNNLNAMALLAGKYYFTVRDDSLCAKVDSIEITEPAAINSNIVVNHISCNGNTNGNANVNVSGGIAPYTYSWSNSSSDSSLIGLAPGVYGLTITDANLCSHQDSATIFEPTEIIIDTVTVVNASGGNNGTITISVIGGTPAYAYSWSNGSTTQNISNLAPGVYSVVVTDMNLCQDSLVNIALIGVGINPNSIANELQLFPNPNNGNFQFTVNSRQKFLLLNSLNQIISEINTDANKTYHFNEVLPPGMYYLKNVNENKNLVYKILIQ
jgi:hypothetical protein